MARSDEKREKRDEGTITDTTSSSKVTYNKFVPYSCFNVIVSKFNDPLYMIKNQFFISYSEIIICILRLFYH